MINTRMVRVNNAEVEIMERAGREPTLVWVHGNSMSSKMWQKQLEAPLLQPYKMLLLDLPGHGGSAPSRQPATDYNVPGYAVSIQTLLGQLGLEPYILIGLSLGGNIALEMLPHLTKETCRGIMVIGTAIIDTPAALAEAFLPNPATNSLFKGACTAEELAALLQTVSGRHYPEALPAFVAADFLNTDPACRIYMGESIGQGDFSDVITYVKETPIPVAVVTGAAEQIINNEYLTNLSVPMWRHQVQVIPEAGHLLPWEKAEDFNNLLLAFVQDCIEIQ